MTEAEQRQRVVQVAQSWLGTPYHTGARVKGQGADCLTILAEIFHEAGVVPRVSIPYYPPDWHLHRDTERYLQGLLQYASEVKGPPQPGDIALWKFGRCFSHGAVVINWPHVIHAYIGSCCRHENAETARWLKFVGEGGAEQGKLRPTRYFSIWG